MGHPPGGWPISMSARDQIMAASRDFYEVLGVSKSANADEIKRAYRKAAATNHPDRNPGDEEAERRFKEAAEAYEVLSNDQKRQLYDRVGHDAFQRSGGGGAGGGGAGFADVEDIFNAFGGIFGDLFGGQQGRGGGRSGPRVARGEHLRVRVELDLKEVAQGCDRVISLTRQETCTECAGSGAKAGSKPVPCGDCGGRGQRVQQQGFFRMQVVCPSCRGAGEVIRDRCAKCSGAGRVAGKVPITIPIPAGVEEGMQLQVRGEGNVGERGGPRGDLLCDLAFRDHPLFEREGSNLHMEAPISFSQAVLGTSFEIPLLAGKHKVEIPAGTQPGDVLKIRGEGLPHYQTQRRGDLLVHVQVEVPKKLTPRQSELIRELAELEHKQVSARQKSFLEKVKDLFVASEESSNEERS